MLTRYPPPWGGGVSGGDLGNKPILGGDLGNKDFGHGFWEISDRKIRASAARKNDVSEVFEFLNPKKFRLRRC